MAFKELSALLGEQPSEKSQVLSVENAFPTDGSFLLYHFGAQSLRAGSEVWFLCARHPRFHHETVAAKLGVPFKSRLPSARLPKFVDFTQILAAEPGIILGESESGGLLRRVWQQLDGLKSEDEATLTRRPLTILVDSLDAFVDLGMTCKDAWRLFVGCRSLVRCRGGGSLVVVTDSDEEEGLVDDQARHSLSAAVAHASHTRLLLLPLSPLHFAKDVSGTLEILARDARLVGQSTALHYRLGDRSVAFFAPGLSAPRL